MTKEVGRFIVFEGGEGSGKSSAMQVAMDCLDAAGIKSIRTREPGGTRGAEMIRSILITDGSDFDPVTNTLLFAAARRDHVEKVIKPALSEGIWVVSDRFVLSTLAYQGAEGMREETILDIHRMTVDGILPDLTIIMDVDPLIGLERSKRRLANEDSSEGRFESYEIDFHKKLRKFNLEYTHSPAVVVDANQPLEVAQEQVRKEIGKFISFHAKFG